MSNEDHILGAADFEKRKEAMKEWQATHADPRHKYIAHYTFMGQPRSEEVWEMNAEAAEQHVKAEWSKCGVCLYDVMIKEA